MGTPPSSPAPARTSDVRSPKQRVAEGCDVAISARTRAPLERRTTQMRIQPVAGFCGSLAT